MIDDMFKDCEDIACKYEQKLVDVVYQYVIIEERYRRQLTRVEYSVVLSELKDYYEKKVRVD